MKSFKWFLLLSAVLMLVSMGSRAQETQKPQKRPGSLRGECCLWRLALDGSGKLKYDLGKPHECKTGQTAQGSGYLELKPLKSPGMPCDEEHKLIPEGSQLNAAIHPIHRKDDLAYISGTFTIRHNETLIFEGDIELFHRINTHHSKPFGTLPCDHKLLQGWLTGAGAEKGPAKGYLIRAMLVAGTDPIEQGTAGYYLGQTHVNGVVIRCKE